MSNGIEVRNPKGAGRRPKLTELEKTAIKTEYQDGQKIEILAAKFGVSYSTILRTVKQ